MAAVVHADGAFARVMREAAALGTRVQRHDGVGRQCAEAHAGDVEDAGLVGLGAGGAAGAYGHAEVMGGHVGGRHGVVDPLITHGLHVQLRAEGALVGLALGPLVDERSLLAGEGGRLVVALDEVLPHLGPDELQQEAQVPDDGVIAQHSMPGLRHVVPAECGQQRRRQRPQRVQCAQGHRGQRDDEDSPAQEPRHSSQGPGPAQTLEHHRHQLPPARLSRS